MPYTRLYSVHPYWWKRQVSHQMWPSGSQHASKKECRQDIHSGFKTHEEGHTKSKTGAISGSTKWTLVQTKNFKKPKKTDVWNPKKSTRGFILKGWDGGGKQTILAKSEVLAVREKFSFRERQKTILCWIRNPYFPWNVFIFWVGGVVGPAESEVQVAHEKFSFLMGRRNCPCWIWIQFSLRAYFHILRGETNCLTDKVLQLKYVWFITICPAILFHKMCDGTKNCAILWQLSYVYKGFRS